MPAILLVPVWAGSDSSSSVPSGKNPMSAQSRAVANRSTIPASRVMILAKYSDGTVYVGSGDGLVYALSTSAGS